MPSIADPRALADLCVRLGALTPDAPRRWGTLTAAEMLCHLGDAGESVLGLRVVEGTPAAVVSRPIRKWVALRTTIPWPKGVPTRAHVDPKRGGSQPGDFEQDRARVIAGLAGLAGASAAQLAPAHAMFGRMSPADWHHWAWRHVDHHLRQFGL